MLMLPMRSSSPFPVLAQFAYHARRFLETRQLINRASHTNCVDGITKVCFMQGTFRLRVYPGSPPCPSAVSVGLCVLGCAYGRMSVGLWVCAASVGLCVHVNVGL